MSEKKRRAGSRSHNQFRFQGVNPFMSQSLALILRASQPTLDDQLDNLLLLGLGFLIVIFALIACALLLDRRSKADGRSAGWLEHKAARRPSKRAVLRKHYPPLRIVRSRQEQADTSRLAQNALRRAAEAAQHIEPAPARAQPNLRVVKPRERL